MIFDWFNACSVNCFKLKIYENFTFRGALAFELVSLTITYSSEAGILFRKNYCPSVANLKKVYL